MPTLHNAAEKTKKIGILLVFAVAVITFLFWLFGVGKTLKEKYFPTPSAPPTVSFGKLPKQIFPDGAQTPNLTYSVDTLSGNLPTFSDRHAVRKIAVPIPTLLSLKKAKDIVAGAGFNPNGKQVSEWLHEWTEEKESGRTLALNILTYNFTLTSPQLSITGWEKEFPPADADAISAAQTFTMSISAFPSDIDFDKTKLTYFSVKDGSLVRAEKVHMRKAVRVDFFQANFDESPVVYATPNFSSMNFLVGPKNSLVSASFFHNNVTGEIATYPIKTSQAAFDELKSGSAYIVSHDGTSTDITITDVSLAYYSSPVEQSFLMPIFVFEGSDNFVAYVPAISNDWMEETTESGRAQ